ncbi:MAG: peptidoglycan-binding protein [Clostridiales bacterium]|nr:peptidoglycan-binding protein [Clostridiales bacterium]
MTGYDGWIRSKSPHWISNSGSDERGRTHGGAPGDQTGGEWRLRAWYARPWTCVLRHPDARVQAALAKLAVDAAQNDMVGYDQYRRETYWKQLERAGFDASKIDAKCSADCTAGIAANAKAAGYLLGIDALKAIRTDTYSGDMRARFRAAGFRAMTEDRLLNGHAWLLPGDVLLCEGRHAATNVTVGVKACWRDPEVLALQAALLRWDPDCLPRWGADGEWGAETAAALSAFQQAHGLAPTGLPGDDVMRALGGAAEVEITGGTVNVRAAPMGDVLGVARRGMKLRYLGVTDADGWMNVDWRGQSAWVRDTMGRVVT